MSNKQMKPAKVKQLEEIAARIERLCDNRDLLLEAMRDEFDAAEKEGFDRDGLCLLIRRRVGDLTGDAFHNQNAMKYMHALGDIDCEDACGHLERQKKEDACGSLCASDAHQHPQGSAKKKDAA